MIIYELYIITYIWSDIDLYRDYIGVTFFLYLLIYFTISNKIEFLL